MTHKNFRRLQNELDQLGFATTIRKQGNSYDCIVNFEIKKSYKTRGSAKKYFIKMLEQEKASLVAMVTA